MVSRICFQCRFSTKQYYQNHKEQKKKYQKDRRRKNLKKIRKQEKLYRKKIKLTKKTQKEYIKKIKKGYQKNRYLLTQGRMINLGPIMQEKKEQKRQCTIHELKQLKQQKKHFVVLHTGF
jgi:hypothetical protein